MKFVATRKKLGQIKLENHITIDDEVMIKTTSVVTRCTKSH